MNREDHDHHGTENLPPGGRKFPAPSVIPGVRLATAISASVTRARDDLMVAILDPGTTIAGVLAAR